MPALSPPARPPIILVVELRGHPPGRVRLGHTPLAFQLPGLCAGATSCRVLGAGSSCLAGVVPSWPNSQRIGK